MLSHGVCESEFYIWAFAWVVKDEWVVVWNIVKVSLVEYVLGMACPR